MNSNTIITQQTKDYIEEYKDDYSKEDVVITLLSEAYGSLRWGHLLQAISKSDLNVNAKSQNISKRINRYKTYLNQ